MKLFQTVKLDIETWRLIDKVASNDNIAFSEALERLVRHGFIRYEQVVREQTALLVNEST